ncbi:hypothetical protein [Robertmurraya andreesenii]|uniref:Uncharacterized protein n=1 Tax=Anoxybacillus andreesenii TaxID=1325932 RepID=A0ABT9V5M6_9BACL|nr:hypothetical protein [Robertmurraya andreesenii]MDQ0156246.1 hypothetical protein [Robertmurraya andreesenii]
MASNIYATKCPCCGRSAIEDYYYKTGEQYTICIRCGYNYSKTIKKWTTDCLEYKEEENEGNGVVVLEEKGGNRKKILLDSVVTDEQLEDYKTSFWAENINQEKSYVVLFKDGVFTVFLGYPPENFYLSFEDYREKMFAKYGYPDYDFMVPIEE